MMISLRQPRQDCEQLLCNYLSAPLVQVTTVGGVFLWKVAICLPSLHKCRRAAVPWERFRLGKVKERLFPRIPLSEQVVILIPFYDIGVAVRRTADKTLYHGLG